MNPQAAPVALTNITNRFGKEVVAVDDVTLEVTPGSLFTLLGPSGCGKTTTLRMIAGLERASSGKVFIGDEDVTNLPANLRDVTMVFQSYALFPHMNVMENVAYGLQVARVSKDEVRRRALEALALVGLEGLESRATNALSGGQQQRVALARSLVLQPKVLLFDEPLSNLDAKLRRRVREEIRDLQQRLGITSVYVTHDQEEALAISDVIVVMNGGHIEQQGSPVELYTKPVNRFVADFIGSASFLEGQFDGHQVDVAGYCFPHRQTIPSGPVTVMARPEAVTLAHERGLEARVVSTAYLGSVTDFVFDTAAGEVLASIPGEGKMPLAKGDTTHLNFKPAGIHLLAHQGQGGIT
ncbi:ABC transporter ATP-binding protein [soil metagenome]